MVSVPEPEKKAATAPPQGEPIDPFAGKGYLLECTDPEAFRAIDALVKRQELLARNRWAKDKHYTATKMGYTGSTLIKVENQDSYRQFFLPGTADRLQSAAVPNKQAELCEKLTETLLVDPPKLDPVPETDDEVAQRGAELAKEYLEQDGSEAGTDDLTLFSVQIEAATTRASTFNYYWVDPVGGGSMPKQIKAHPLAQDPANPLVGPDGQPTTDYILRYVTAGDETGAGARFTANPSEAERVWIPRVRIKRLGREHVRLYPETADLHDAQQAIVLDYCTVAEARRRWPETLGEFTDAEFLPLVGWTPTYPQRLLPPSVRRQWREGYEAAQNGDRLSAMDQRILFYYAYHGLAEPDYPEGAVVCVNGADGGFVLGKDTLTATVEVPSEVAQDEVVTDRKDLDIPLVQVRLLPDTEEKDPMGKCFMARVAGGGEAGNIMAVAMMQAIDQVLNPVRYSIGTSSASADDVESARSTGDFVNVLNKDEVPQLEAPRELPGAYFNYIDWLYNQLDSAAGLRPPDTAGEAKVKSGVALRIEVSEASKTLTRMNYAVHMAWARHGRIKLQMAMKHFSVPQLLRYVGADGAAKQEWFTGNNFARVGGVTILSGSGTMLPPQEKVNYALQLAAAQQMDPDEAADVARPAFAKQLGVPENPHVQRIERQVSSWLEGPPEGWEEANALYQQQVQQHAMMAQQAMQAAPVDPMTGRPVTPELPPEPQAPWTPFFAEVMDSEPPIATIRKRRLVRLMAKTEFSKFGEPWKQVVRDAYMVTVQALMAAQASAQPPQAVSPDSEAGGAEPMETAA